MTFLAQMRLEHELLDELFDQDGLKFMLHPSRFDLAEEVEDIKQSFFGLQSVANGIDFLDPAAFDHCLGHYLFVVLPIDRDDVLAIVDQVVDRPWLQVPLHELS